MDWETEIALLKQSVIDIRASMLKLSGNVEGLVTLSNQLAGVILFLKFVTFGGILTVGLALLKLWTGKP